MAPQPPGPAPSATERPRRGLRRLLDYLEPDLGPLEDEYRRHYLPADISHALAGNVIAIIVSIFFVYIDFRFFGWGVAFYFLLFLRLAMLVVALAMYRALARARAPRTVDRLVFYSELAMVTAAVIVNLSRPATYWQSPVVDVLVIVAFYTLIPQPLASRLLISLGFSLVSAAVLIFTKVGIPAVTLNILLVALVMANGLGLLVSTRLFNYRRSQYKALVDQRAAQAALEYLATTDSLTGILNRRSFLAAAQQEFGRFCRHARPFSIVLIDLDRFKRINDTYGHQAGDQALRAVADLVARGGRTVDTFGRVGGEEFGLLLPEASLAEAAQAAERLRRLCEALEVTCEGTRIAVTFSAGVAQVTPADAGLDSLMRRADLALYRAKELGRNRVETLEA